MASCDDDFSHLSDGNPSDHHHHLYHHHHLHHQSFSSQQFDPKSTTIHSSQSLINVDATIPSNNSFAVNNEDQRPKEDNQDKRREIEEHSDGGTSYSLKKNRIMSSSNGSSSNNYRKEREEWSDSAIECLLDAYTDKYFQLNRGNLWGRDWDEVASVVSNRSDKKSAKSADQCKNKLDNLKKRYKVELQRMENGSLSVSNWPWFKKIENIVGSAVSNKMVCNGEEDKSQGMSGSLRQPKRCTVATPTSVGLINSAKTRQLSNRRWRRVVFKISGSALAGNCAHNVDSKVIMQIAREVAMANRVGVEVAIVMGGSNLFCGDTWVASVGLDRSTSYQIGLMATLMNSIILQSSLEKHGLQTRVQTSCSMQEFAEPYIKYRAIRHLEKGRIVIFGGMSAETGNTLFTTDTAAVLRASEINAEVVIKGFGVNCLYDNHSRSNNQALFQHISFRDSVARGGTAMDVAAITFCEENNIPVVVFNLLEEGNIYKALCGEQVGTLIDHMGRIS